MYVKNNLFDQTLRHFDPIDRQLSDKYFSAIMFFPKAEEPQPLSAYRTFLNLPAPTRTNEKINIATAYVDRHRRNSRENQ